MTDLCSLFSIIHILINAQEYRIAIAFKEKFINEASLSGFDGIPITDDGHG